jgi:hypothetical protein
MLGTGGKGGERQRWASTLANRSNVDRDRIPDLRSEGVKDRTFFKKAKIVPSTAIVYVEGGTFTLSM